MKSLKQFIEQRSESVSTKIFNIFGKYKMDSNISANDFDFIWNNIKNKSFVKEINAKEIDINNVNINKPFIDLNHDEDRWIRIFCGKTFKINNEEFDTIELYQEEDKTSKIEPVFYSYKDYIDSVFDDTVNIYEISPDVINKILNILN